MMMMSVLEDDSIDASVAVAVAAFASAVVASVSIDHHTVTEKTMAVVLVVVLEQQHDTEIAH